MAARRLRRDRLHLLLTLVRAHDLPGFAAEGAIDALLLEGHDEGEHVRIADLIEWLRDEVPSATGRAWAGAPQT